VLRAYVRELARHGGGRLALALALLLVVTLLEGAGLLLLVPLLELAGVLGARPPSRLAAPFAAAGLRPTLPLVLALFVAVVTGRALLATRRDLLLTDLQLGFTDGVRKRLFAGIAAARWPWLSRRRRSDLLNALTGDANRIAAGTRLLLEGLVAAGMALTHVVVAVLLSPAVALAATAAAAVLLALSAAPVRRARRHGERLSHGGRRLLGTAAEFLDGVKLAKSHDREGAHVAAFAATLDAERDAWLDYERSRGATAAAQQAAGVVMLAGVVWAAVGMAHLQPARLIALVFVFSRLLPLTSDLVRRAQQVAQMLAAYATVAATTQAAEAAAEPAGDGGDPRDDLRLRASIRLDAATVRYRPDGPPALDRATLVIPARSTTAVVGPSGAGKTTLVDVLLGLLPLSAGTVEVDGRTLAGPARPWRRRVAYVPQETPVRRHRRQQPALGAAGGVGRRAVGGPAARRRRRLRARPARRARQPRRRARRAPLRRGAPAARPRPRPAAPPGRAAARRGHQQPRRRQRGGGGRHPRAPPRHGHDRGGHPQPRGHPPCRPRGRARRRARGRRPHPGGPAMSPTGRPPPLRTTVAASGDRDLDLRWTARRLALEAMAAQMLTELEALGVAAVLLKGPVTARRLYPGEFRPFVDVDLLVPPHGHAVALGWLRRNGFHAVPAGSATFRRPGDGATVDLHLTLPETSATAERTWEVLAGHRVAFELQGRAVGALDEAAHACHLAIHAVQSGNRNPRPRADLDRAVARLPARTWAGALTVARQLGAEAALLAALRCQAADGDRVADALGLPSAPFPARLRAADASAASEMLRRLPSMPWRDRVRHLRLWTFPTRAAFAGRRAQPNTPRWLTARLPWWLGHLALRAWQLAAIARALAAARSGRRPGRAG
jgi:ATP-binding cassette subfamily C protein